MKFRELRDVVEKMSGQKLTGQEVSTWYKKNPDVKKAVKDAKIKQAVELALDHGGAMNYAIKKIEKIKRGLADHPAVAKALSYANFGEENTLEDVSEEKIAILTSVYKSVKRDMDKLMKKHDAYVSDTSRDGTTISSPKPMGAFIKDVQKLIGLKESVEFLSEGTWAIPSTIDKMKQFQAMLQKPMFAKNKGAVEKFKNSIYSLMGDDQLFDVYDRMIMDKDFNGQDMVELLVKSLEGRWFNFKKKGKGWVATHQYFAMEPEDVDEAQSPAQKAAFKKMLDAKKDGEEDKDTKKEGKGRPTGHYKPKKKIKVENLEEAVAKLDPLDRAERVLNYKLKEIQYKTALKSFNEYDANPEVKKEARGATGLDNAALAKRVPQRFKGIDQKTAQRVADAVKPKGTISSKLYMELGDLWDKKGMKGIDALLKKHKV
jgi:hypothetical protein